MRNKIGLIALFFYLTITFQNCSKVNFEGSESQASTKGAGEDVVREPVIDDSDPVDETIIDDEDEVIDSVVSKNTACDPIFNSGSFIDLKGQDFLLNGFQQEVRVSNGGLVRVNGAGELLSVNGAKEVNANGVHHSVCIKAEVFDLNGSAGLAGVPVVLIGQGDSSIAKNFNGLILADLVLIDIKQAARINSASFNSYIYSSQIDTINGAGFDLHLMKGSHVKRINGVFRNIFLYDGSSIDELNGSYKLVRVKKK